MLDTDIVSYAIRGNGAVQSRMLACRPSELCMSAMSLAELRRGASRLRSLKLHDLIGGITMYLNVMPFDASCAARYGELVNDLERRGTPIGDFDTLIAAHAITIGATLVTNNVRHFSRIPRLGVENWT
ncbi:MAG TPA: type II toxin-antitoxin system VapC family toxin [Thermoanaerobaculia bacterium]|nr:type II toxin-antitoxin system VapC family toxin [Thermoanaerobaculia bacterium]